MGNFVLVKTWKLQLLSFYVWCFNRTLSIYTNLYMMNNPTRPWRPTTVELPTITVLFSRALRSQKSICIPLSLSRPLSSSSSHHLALQKKDNLSWNMLMLFSTFNLSPLYFLSYFIGNGQKTLRHQRTLTSGNTYKPKVTFLNS